MDKNEKNIYIRRFILLTAAFFAAYALSFAVGRYPISLKGKMSALERARIANVFWQIRFPRITAAALVGAALSTAGAAYQGTFRNPMVSPDLLGASSGAGFGAALGILLALNYGGITLLSFGFGLLAVFAAMLVAKAARGDRVLSLVLAGIVISSLFSAGTSFIKLVADTEETLPAITYWLMGSLSSIRMNNLTAAIPILAGMAVLYLLRWRLNLLTMGEEEARSVGVNPNRLRIVVIFCATLMTAASVAISGMIGWVGLVIPHFVRILFGYDYRRVIPASALMGATFLIVVDDVARVAVTSELPIGILTSFIGAPVFLYLIWKGEKHDGSLRT
jgi:iron complex transport system permease protein